MSLDLGDDSDAFAGLAENTTNLIDVVWTANERRKHDVDLYTLIAATAATVSSTAS